MNGHKYIEVKLLCTKCRCHYTFLFLTTQLVNVFILEVNVMCQLCNEEGKQGIDFQI